jgi:membrane fusion protein, multidrug efflux system
MPFSPSRPSCGSSCVVRFWAALFTGVLFLTGCGEDGPEGQVARAAGSPPGAGPGGGGPAERAVPVSARIARAGDLEVTLRGSTNLRARAAVDVIPRQSGLVAEIRAEEGQRVSEGDLLAQLEDEEWRLQALQSGARARAAADAVERARALARAGLVPVQEVERLAFDSAVARADSELAELRVRNAAIRSPIDGVITHRYIERGSQVGTTNPAFGVADLTRLEAQVAVPERDAARVRVGQLARILVEEGGTSVAMGRVERIRPVVDPGSGTVQVTVTVPTTGVTALRPGQFVNVDIVTETLPDRITLPRTSVLVDGAVPRVYIVQDGAAREREVTLGYSRGDRVEITGGLQPGDTVVVVGQDNLRPDAPVRLMELDGRPVAGDGAGASR